MAPREIRALPQRLNAAEPGFEARFRDLLSAKREVSADVETTVREIIDAVRPTRAFYTLEPMPWAYPDSVDSYLRLIAAIDRRAFGVHLDPQDAKWVVTHLASGLRMCKIKPEEMLDEDGNTIRLTTAARIAVGRRRIEVGNTWAKMRAATLAAPTLEK